MAELLENHIQQSENKEKEEKNIDEDPFAHMTDMLQNRDSKIINKKKMKKKTFSFEE